MPAKIRSRIEEINDRPKEAFLAFLLRHRRGKTVPAIRAIIALQIKVSSKLFHSLSWLTKCSAFSAGILLKARVLNKIFLELFSLLKIMKPI